MIHCSTAPTWKRDCIVLHDVTQNHTETIMRVCLPPSLEANSPPKWNKSLRPQVVWLRSFNFNQLLKHISLFVLV